jgi:predicted metal-dependent hydrolase
VTSTLTIDELEFEVRRSPRRKTLEIIVDRKGELIISAPDDCPSETMEEFVREKRFWIFTKLAEKETLRVEAPSREFVSGEGHPYLGRNYRLLLVDAQDVPLKLERGRFRLLRSEAPNGRRHFISWYTDHAKPWLAGRVDRWTGRIGVEPKALEVQDLGFRWGSCGSSRVVNFHWATILLPPSLVDYIIVHELAHLKVSNHTPEFWLLVERTMPDFGERRDWMARHGGQLVRL